MAYHWGLRAVHVSTTGRTHASPEGELSGRRHNSLSGRDAVCAHTSGARRTSRQKAWEPVLATADRDAAECDHGYGPVCGRFWFVGPPAGHRCPRVVDGVISRTEVSSGGSWTRLSLGPNVLSD